MRFACGTTFVFLLLYGTPAEAQLCTGNPSFANQPYQAALGAAFTEETHGVAGEFGTGSDLLFASAGVGVVNFRDLDATATQVFAAAGTELAQGGTIFICPIARIGVGFGPDIGPVDVSTFSLAAGGSVG